MNHPPPWHRVYAMARYEYPIPFLIHRFKFQNDQIAGHLLARLFVRHLRNISTPDILLPVPLGRNRLRSRGFNQTVELSRYISRHTPVPTLSNAVDRLQTIDRMQSTLHSKRERKNNVKGVFHVKPSYFNALESKHIAILDDVMTSGATAASLCHALLANGAKKVDVWVLARA